MRPETDLHAEAERLTRLCRQRADQIADLAPGAAAMMRKHRWEVQDGHIVHVEPVFVP